MAKASRFTSYISSAGLRCLLHPKSRIATFIQKNICSPTPVKQLYLKHVSLLQRQSRLDEVTGRTGESDGLGGVPSSQPPLTTPLERRDIPPQLSMTLEHIVGQLDVLTQVRDLFCGS